MSCSEIHVKEKFIVVSRGRTASTFLAKGLNRHPNINMAYEIFHPRKPYPVNGVRYDSKVNSWDFLERNFFGVPVASEEFRGFKLFYYHARSTDKAKAVWRAIQVRDDIKLISLSRLNIFAAYVSEVRARKSKVWHPKAKTDSYSASFAVNIDIEGMQ